MPQKRLSQHNWWRRRQKKNATEKKGKGPKVQPPLVTSENAEEHMTAFTKFYKSINLVAEEEWDTFFRCLFTPVPFCFRLSENRRKCNNAFEGKPGCVGEAEALRDHFKEHVLPTTEGYRMKDGTLFQCNPVPLFPNELVWQCNIDQKSLLNKTWLKTFRKFMFEEERCNTIYKQDVSRFIGPLLVDINPDDKILELCCAPGHQTVQIAEQLHADPNKPPEGFILCNDKDIDQIRYMWTTGPNTMFVHEVAERFPDIYTTPEKDPESKLQFDLVFLDAPSSQDGMMRKDVYRRGGWDINNALKQHTRLRKMLLRGLQLLAVNGKLLYCTSSMNPIENEAVVAALLREGKGSVELVDISHKVTNFKIRPGLETWKIMNAGNVNYKDYASCPSWFKKDVRESVFPPNEQEMVEFQLKKCMRILPHDNNTNAAFYALIQKTAPLPEIPKTSNAKPETSQVEGKEECCVRIVVEEPQETEGTEERVEDEDPDQHDGDPDQDADDVEADGEKEEDIDDKNEDGKLQVKEDKEDSQKDEKARLLDKKKRKKLRYQERKRRNVQFEKEMVVTEIDWETEVTDTDLSTVVVKETLKYRQPKLKLTRNYMKAFFPDKFDNLTAHFEDVEPDSPALRALSDVLGVTVKSPETQLMVVVPDTKAAQYYYTNPLVKKIVQCNQRLFQQVATQSAGLRLMKLEDEDVNEMAIQPLLPMIMGVKKRMVHVTRDDLIAMLSDKTIHMSTLSAVVQQQLSRLDDRGPIFFIYEPKGLNANPKCPILLQRYKIKMYIQDSNYNTIENSHYLRLCGVINEQDDDNDDDEQNDDKVEVKVELGDGVDEDGEEEGEK